MNANHDSERDDSEAESDANERESIRDDSRGGGSCNHEDNWREEFRVYRHQRTAELRRELDARVLSKSVLAMYSFVLGTNGKPASDDWFIQLSRRSEVSRRVHEAYSRHIVMEMPDEIFIADYICELFYRARSRNQKWREQLIALPSHASHPFISRISNEIEPSAIVDAVLAEFLDDAAWASRSPFLNSASRQSFISQTRQTWRDFALSSTEVIAGCPFSDSIILRELDRVRKRRKNPESFSSSSSVGNAQRFRILVRDRFRCRKCGRNPEEDGVKLEVDHILPRSRGGSSDDSNLQTLCRECNGGKSNKYAI